LERLNAMTRRVAAASAPELCAPVLCISRRILENVFLRSVDALGTYRNVGSSIDFMASPVGDGSRLRPPGPVTLKFTRTLAISASTISRRESYTAVGRAQPDDSRSRRRFPTAVSRIDQAVVTRSDDVRVLSVAKASSI
jgi:hypothetical protein